MKGGDICLYGAIRGMSWFYGIDVMSRKGEIGLIAPGLPTLLINVNSDTCSKLTELTMCSFHKQLRECVYVMSSSNGDHTDLGTCRQKTSFYGD